MIWPEMLTNKWPQKPLGEVVEFLDHLRRPITAKDRELGPYPYYGANGQQDSVADYLFDEPLVLLAEDGGYFGDPERCIAYRVKGKCWVNNHAHVLRPKENVDLDFLCRVLEKYDVSKFINGATRAKLNKGIASTIPIPLPPLPEQRRIAAILDKADAIRRKRQQSIRLTEAFLRSVFLDMFGDIPAKKCKFDFGTIRSFVSAQSGKSSKLVISEKQTGIPIYGGNGVNGWATRPLFEKPVIVVGRVGQQCGIVHVTEGPSWVTDNAIVTIITDPEKLHPVFLAEALQNSPMRATVQRLDLPFINQSMILDYPIPIPPINEQIKFSEIKKKAMTHNTLLIKEYETTEMLFNSLIQRAFRGEL